MKRFKTQAIINPESNLGRTHLSHPKISFIRDRHVEAFSPEEEDVLPELDGEQ